MKFFHLSDLHLGKSVHEFSMVEEQEYILKSILAIADREQPRCVLIAGDVFDRSVAPAEALRLFDDFLVGLARRQIAVFIISGNHDSAERLAFAARLMSGAGVHIAPAYEGQLIRHVLTDEFGEIDVYLLPFIRPAMVRRFFPERKIETWTDAVRCVLSQAELLPGCRSILLAHQFVTGGITSDSEESSVGGADNVDAAAFGGFDYVALGHLHGPQRMGRDSLRYSGSPLKYSFSEAGHQKSLTVVEMGPKGSLEIRQVPLTPRHDLKELKGSYEQVAGKAFYDALDREDYFRVTLTDEQDQPDAMAKLRVIYPRLMRLEYDNKRTRAQDSMNDAEDTRALSPLELFHSLYREQNGQDLTMQQREYLNEKIGTVWGEAR